MQKNASGRVVGCREWVDGGEEKSQSRELTGNSGVRGKIPIFRIEIFNF